MKPKTQPLRILVAEDDEADFAFLQHMLRNSQVLLFRVSDGEEAIEYLKGIGRYSDRTACPLPDFLLLDLRLPKISGHEVLEWLRGEAKFKFLRVYVLAASDRESDRLRAQKAGADNYFIKPLSLGHLAVLFGPPVGAGAEIGV